MVDHPEHLYITDDFIVTHNTEFLVSLVYNSLIHGSGFIYVDGKADSSLYGKVYSMARAMGREDDVLVINFQTGAKDIYGAQPTKLSNTLNPFAVGSAGMLSELVKGLMASGEKSTWTQQAESYVEALMKPLVFLRDVHGMDLDVNVIRGYFGINETEDLAWIAPDQYAGLEESGALDGIRNYLLTKPGYKREKYHDQSDSTLEQHGFITMQLIRTFNSLSDTYGYIMKTPLAEIDFVDVFLNRRILVVLLPALEKSPTELTNLGRIVVASIKATMAKGLGSALEGTWKKVIDSKPTTSPSPFTCVLDEYGYYAVEGFAVVPAQARSLGFSAVFAGQDLPAFQKASKEEAESTLANTNTRLCGKLECTKTYDFFKDIAGHGYYSKNESYKVESGDIVGGGFKRDDSIRTESIARVSFDALRGQVSGQWHLFFANTIVRVKSFFANPKAVTNLRVNHFIKVARPSASEIASHKYAYKTFLAAITSPNGLRDYVDHVSAPEDINDIHHGFELFKQDDVLLKGGKILAYGAYVEAQRAINFANFSAMTSTASSAPSVEEKTNIDFAKVMGGDFDDEDEGEAYDPLTAYQGSAENRSQHAAADPMGSTGDAPSYRAPAASDRSSTPSKSWGDDMLQGIDRSFLDGIPDSVVQAQEEADREEEQLQKAMAAFAQENHSEAKPGELISNHARDEFDHLQTTAFGVDGEINPPILNVSAEDDIATDSMDIPQTIDQVESPHTGSFMAEFDEPMADGGLLSRVATESGIEAIERAAGAPKHEASMTAAANAEAIARATTYPITPPTRKPDISELEDLANQVSNMLTSADND